MKPKLILTCLLLTAYCGLMTGTIRYVSKTGSSTPPYTSWVTASDSIQKCINICNNGDTVIVANGIYKETLLIDSALTLLGSSMDSCIIDGSGLTGNNGITVKSNNYLNIQNFNVKGKGIEPLTGVIGNGKNPFRGKNLMIENANSGISIRGGGTVENCFFISLANCIYTSSSFNQDTIRILNNFMQNSQPEGDGIFNSGGGIHYIYSNILLGLNPSLFYGIDLSLDNYSEVKNNLVANYRFRNYDGSEFLDKAIIENNVLLQNNVNNNLSDNVVIVKGNGTTIRNNIIAYSFRYGINAENDTAFADHNLFWLNGSNSNSKVKLGEHNVKGDPMFINDTIPTEEMNFDYHLQAYSPAINAGDTAIFDIDGSRSDIGMYGGPFGTSYNYKDLAPKPPVNLSAVVDSNKITLRWNKNTEADTNHYNIYRDTTQNFSLDTTKLIASQSDTLLLQTTSPNVSRYVYKISCVDNQGNESIPSEEIVINLTAINDYPMTINDYILYQNYPNPFNPNTTIGYRLKEGGYVKLMVYDIKAELIQVLVNNTQEPGYHEVEFNAEKLSSGIGYASGVYLYRIEIIDENNIPRYSDMKKLIYLK